MSRQATLDTFFAVRKRPSDLQPAKKRKITPDITPTSSPSTQIKPTFQPLLTTESVTSVRDDHLFPQTPSSGRDKVVESTRSHKRDAFGLAKQQADQTPPSNAPIQGVEGEKEVSKFSVGSSEPRAKKRLDYGKCAKSKTVGFVKKGPLSPQKVAPPIFNVKFQKKGTLSPQKKKSIDNLNEVSQTLSEAKKQLQKLTPDEIKAKLSKVGRLADLKDKMAKLNNFKIPPPSPIKSSLPPKLTQDSISLDLRVPNRHPTSPSKAFKSPVKVASPRKTAILDRSEDMDADLPIPSSYRFLSEVFRTLDHIVSIKFNRKEVIKVQDLKSSVQSALKRNFSENYLKQIKCVFPQAFKFVWEQMIGKYGLKKEDYELHMFPNINYLADLHHEASASDLTVQYERACFTPLTPKILVERRNLFKKLLISMVKDHHKAFLASLNPPLSVENDKLRRWHKDFEVESCPDVDMAELPSKPNVVKVAKAHDILHAKRDLFGINAKLVNALQEQADRDKAKEEKVKEEQEEKPIVKKGLEGLPPALLEKIMKREKAKQIRDMVENSSDRKDSEMLEDLVMIGPMIINCYKSEKQRQNKAALEINDFVKFVADAYGRKSPREMENLVRYLLKVAPEFFQTLFLRKTEYFKMKAGCPDLNNLVTKIKNLLEEKNKVQ